MRSAWSISASGAPTPVSIGRAWTKRIPTTERPWPASPGPSSGSGGTSWLSTASGSNTGGTTAHGGSSMSWCFKVRSRFEARSLLALCLVFQGGHAAAADAGRFALEVTGPNAYTVVVAEDVPLADISLDELRRVFVLKRAF